MKLPLDPISFILGAIGSQCVARNRAKGSSYHGMRFSVDTPRRGRA